jgi:hypothetical protein
LAELLDSDDKKVRLEAAETMLDRHLGQAAIRADIGLHHADAEGHVGKMLGVAVRHATAEAADAIGAEFGIAAGKNAGPPLSPARLNLASPKSSRNPTQSTQRREQSCPLSCLSCS